MSAQMNVPKLRFPEFSMEWEEKKLGEVTTYVDYRGRAPTKTEEGHFLVTAKNIKKGFIDYECSKEYVAENDYLNVMSKGLPEIGDVLFTTEAPMGNVAQVDDKNIALAQRVIKFRSKKMISNLYLLHYMLSAIFQKSISEKSIGTTVQGISGKELHRIRLAFPSLHEQQKIASFLSAVDTKINQLTHKKELLEQYKKGVMQKIFSQELRFKDEDGSEFPEWEEKQLGEIGDFKSGIGFPETEQGGDSGVPFFKVSDMNLIDNTFYMKSANHYVTDKQISKLKFKVIKEASIIFAKVGAAIFLERKRIAVNFLIDNNMMAFTPKANLLFMKYIFDTIKLSKYAQVGALPSYNASDLKIIKVKIPFSKDEQHKIANFLSAIDTKIDFIAKQLEEAKNFKKGLLQQMFV